MRYRWTVKVKKGFLRKNIAIISISGLIQGEWGKLDVNQIFLM
jgi:hypothetical protein